MISYRDEGILPAPPATVWKLINAHLDDTAISSIHRLILEQKTESRGTPETVVSRVIDARGRRLRSRWKLTLRPPELYRWEILDGEGPWSAGTYMENTFSEVPGGTKAVSQGQLHISVLPFFLPQGFMVRRILNEIDGEDMARLRALGTG
ncbi:MAG TPA: SRPBCC family protein [Thermoplasmata archaeon]|nr:SRPBCC family protein [Thermoplasmata archaeon]